ncbi:unnamed protein product [Pylaiella littoralis]
MDGGDKEGDYGGPSGQRGSGVEVARRKKQPEAKLGGGRIGKPVRRKSRRGVAAAKDVRQKQLYGGASDRRHECD